MAIRINIRKLKSLLWVLCAIAVVFAGLTFYDIFQGKQNDRYRPKQPEYFHTLLRRDVDPDAGMVDHSAYYAEERYVELWKARYDGSVKPKPVEPGKDQQDKGPQAPQLEPIDQVVGVSMIVWSNDPLLRFVGIRYKDTAQPAQETGAPDDKLRRIHLTEGQPLRPPYDVAPYNARILEIDKQQVVIQWGDEKKTLNPNLGGDGTGVTLDDFTVAEAEDPLAGLDTAPEESVEVEEGRWILGLKDRQAIRDDARKILDEDLSVTSVADASSNRSVLKLDKVDPDSLPAKYGLQDGDRILAVNGIPMPSLAAAINWGKANSDVPVYDVLVERFGKQFHLIIHNPSTG